MSVGNRSTRSQALENEGGETDSGNGSAAADGAQDDQQAGNVPVPVEEATSPDEASVTQPQAETQQPNPYQYRDLVAQEEMADAGFWMMVAAFLTFAVTTIGTILIWRQVRHTKVAIDETGRATAAMIESNQITRTSTRAWVVIDDVRFDSLQFNQGPPGKILGFLESQVTLKNVGKLPAHGVRIGNHFRQLGHGGDGSTDADVVTPGETNKITVRTAVMIDNSYWNTGDPAIGLFSLDIIASYGLHGDPERKETIQNWELGEDAPGDGLRSIRPDRPIGRLKGKFNGTIKMT